MDCKNEFTLRKRFNFQYVIYTRPSICSRGCKALARKLIQNVGIRETSTSQENQML
jgi:hypothetical protein